VADVLKPVDALTHDCRWPYSISSTRGTVHQRAGCDDAIPCLADIVAERYDAGHSSRGSGSKHNFRAYRSLLCGSRRHALMSPKMALCVATEGTVRGTADPGKPPQGKLFELTSLTQENRKVTDSRFSTRRLGLAERET
jgi:hypothetical protein